MLIILFLFAAEGLINNEDDGKVSTLEFNDRTANSLELRANAKAKLAENKLFSVVHQVFQKKLRLESVSLKKHYVDPALVQTHRVFRRRRFFIATI